MVGWVLWQCLVLHLQFHMNEHGTMQHAAYDEQTECGCVLLVFNYTTPGSAMSMPSHWYDLRLWSNMQQPITLPQCPSLCYVELLHNIQMWSYKYIWWWSNQLIFWMDGHLEYHLIVGTCGYMLWMKILKMSWFFQIGNIFLSIFDMQINYVYLTFWHRVSYCQRFALYPRSYLVYW